MTYSIKWDTLKKRAIKHFMGETDINNGLIGGGSRDLAIAAIMKHNITPSSSPLCDESNNNWRALFEAERQEGQRTISHWDVRLAQTLIAKFPTIISAKYANVKPDADVNDKGEWVLFFS